MLGTPRRDARGLRSGYFSHGVQHLNWCPVSSLKSAVLGNTSPKANMEEEMTLPVSDFELLHFCAKKRCQEKVW